MREIKFRAFNKRDKRMYRTTGITCSPTLSAWIVNTEEYDELIVSGESGEIMQYTGVKDKNDKDIYEGDILKFGVGEELKDMLIGEVYYHTPYFRIKHPTGYHGEYSLNNDLVHMASMEVIGNIYQNPDLLV